ncbi:hypothetical protein E3E12_07960 [Formicincola oecophyllae]|uniref:Uncharacterized protein n=1 Tax=Formicincola oecophyllae TaxID=2558361 RepID=A0A4Y6UB06_9PROT|nr:hypothetical protein [Formicincola oecophyllae]QDH14130.1 hypothetical protein E3E12_07960 [Formicincola oecophyllae]
MSTSLDVIITRLARSGQLQLIVNLNPSFPTAKPASSAVDSSSADDDSDSNTSDFADAIKDFSSAIEKLADAAKALNGAGASLASAAKQETKGIKEKLKALGVSSATHAASFVVGDNPVSLASKTNHQVMDVVNQAWTWFKTSYLALRKSSFILGSRGGRMMEASVPLTMATG